ncbi:MAG: O-antigen translocase, partial [Candidatus Pacearchaeota archaeon]|nr:O-antigen translocase [Candidatus Pacearchaeota archaeon]
MNIYRQIFRSSAIVGGASIITLLVGIIKMKALAVLLGPFGVGFLGIYQNIMQLVATIFGCGLQQSGVRQLASVAGDEATLYVVRRTLFISNIVLGVVGMLLLWCFRESVAQLVFGDVV